ncbi:MAG: 4Fe-4S dicluster domain-containing protein [Elusimicrobiales bacterium]|nr:4Fe-4S dicluster domain-containing protein [Elusimicrobiales bacterium]
MKHHILKKSNIDSFIKELSKKMKVVAPVKKWQNNFVFDEINSAEDISTDDYIPTILPPKKYFMPQREVIMNFFKKGKEFEEEIVVSKEKLAIFGIRTCDLAGIQCLNIVFNDKPIDIHFLSRKENIFIIGIECLKYCDEYASCCFVNSHLPNGGYDLFMTDIGDSYFVYINTQEGEEFVEHLKLPKAINQDFQKLEEVRAKKRATFKNEVNIDSNEVSEIFEKSYNSKIWEEVGEKCVSCGNCTNVCPTCYCFDMEDKLDFNLKEGKRIRSWDSCQFETFAKVAGGENFREERALRQRHRVYRKFKFSYDKFNRFFCTGCGRCSRTCMANILLKDILVKMSEEVKF